MKIANTYIYPLTARLKGKATNPYLENFMDGLENHNFHFLNRPAPSNSGIFDILKYLGKLDMVFFHWPESIPEKKLGFIQTLLVIVLLLFKKRFGIKVFWVLHNKESHNKSKRYLKKLIYKHFIRRSDIIITHSQEGIDFLNEQQRVENCYFFHHPVSNNNPIVQNQYQIDLLFWGSVNPYKGIDQFLKYIFDNKLGNDLRITIAGKISSLEYEKTLRKYKTDNITFINKIIPDDELMQLYKISRTIGFVYKERSVLSSGALMDSLTTGLTIIGPNTGAFKDLSAIGLIETYNTYKELIDKVRNTQATSSSRTKLAEFQRNNSWSEFSTKIADLVFSKNAIFKLK